MKTFWNKWCLLSEKTLEFFRHFCKFYNFVLLSYLYFTFLLLSDHVRFSFFFLSNLFSFFVMKRIRNSKHSFYPLCALLFVFYYLSPRRNTADCSNHNCYCSNSLGRITVLPRIQSQQLLKGNILTSFIVFWVNNLSWSYFRNTAFSLLIQGPLA